MSTVLLVVHLLVAIFLVALILLQRSGGGALDGLGGGSGAGNFLTARGTGNLLTRLTAIMATLFFLTSLSLSLYYKDHGNTVGRSILDKPAAEASVPAEAAPPNRRLLRHRALRWRKNKCAAMQQLKGTFFNEGAFVTLKYGKLFIFTGIFKP